MEDACLRCQEEVIAEFMLQEVKIEDNGFFVIRCLLKNSEVEESFIIQTLESINFDNDRLVYSAVLHTACYFAKSKVIDWLLSPDRKLSENQRSILINSQGMANPDPTECQNDEYIKLTPIEIANQFPNLTSDDYKIVQEIIILLINNGVNFRRLISPEDFFISLVNNGYNLVVEKWIDLEAGDSFFTSIIDSKSKQVEELIEKKLKDLGDGELAPLDVDVKNGLLKIKMLLVE